jgi:hypothetical protein
MLRRASAAADDLTVQRFPGAAGCRPLYDDYHDCVLMMTII